MRQGCLDMSHVTTTKSTAGLKTAFTQHHQCIAHLGLKVTPLTAYVSHQHVGINITIYMSTGKAACCYASFCQHACLSISQHDYACKATTDAHAAYVTIATEKQIKTYHDKAFGAQHALCDHAASNQLGALAEDSPHFCLANGHTLLKSRQLALHGSPHVIQQIIDDLVRSHCHACSR